MILKDCIEREDLKAWCLGSLPDERSDRILTHLNDCPRCADTVAEFDGTSDSLLASLKGNPPDEEVQSDVLNDALQQVCQQVMPVDGRHRSTCEREPKVVERIRERIQPDPAQFLEWAESLMEASSLKSRSKN